MEDKTVQQAVVTILNQIYEEDFLGFSYGFRPASSAGCTVVCAPEEEGEFRTRRRYQRFFRQSR